MTELSAVVARRMHSLIFDAPHPRTDLHEAAGEVAQEEVTKMLADVLGDIESLRESPWVIYHPLADAIRKLVGDA